MKHTAPVVPLSASKILEARAAILAQLPKGKIEANDALELVAFHIAGESLGIATSLVVETHPLKSLRWAKIPSAPPFIMGVVNMRGHIYAINDLARFIGLPAHPISEKAHILLLRGGQCAEGKEMELTLLTDDVPQIERVLVKNLIPPPDTLSPILQEYVRGITPQMRMVLDMQRLLSDKRLIVQQLEI